MKLTLRFCETMNYKNKFNQNLLDVCVTGLCFFADGGVQLQIHYIPWSAKRKKL
jgi:hypothetical protein